VTEAGQLTALIADDPMLMAVLRALRATALPDAWLCSGALVGCLWNHLTGRPARHGLKDIDLIYHDARDLSWEAEDRAIRRLAGLSAVAGVAVELRNQARVHLWFPDRFGIAYPPLPDACGSLRYYPARCFAVAARLGRAGVEVAAPFGLAETLAMDVRPNPALPNRAAYAAKAASIAMLWPEARVAPWMPCGGHESASDAPATAGTVCHGPRRL
jgi:hypothetical protein